MKRLILFLSLLMGFSSIKAQTLVERSDNTFTQGDTYLAALKALSIPYGASPTFDGGLARPGSLFFSTTDTALYVWDSVQWLEVGKDTDLSNYYTKAQVDGLLTLYATIDQMNTALALKVDKTTTVNGKPLSGNIVLTAADIGALTQAQADLLYKPISYVPSWVEITGKPVFAPVALSGDYNDLINKPVIPAAQVNSDWNATSGVAQILNKPSTFPPSAHTHPFSEITDKPTTLAGYGITNAYTKTEVDGLVNAKQNTITGAATTIVSANLTANRALISNAAGKVAISPVTDTELGYLTGVTSGIQSQIDLKVDKSTTITNSGGIDIGGSLSSGSVSLGINETFFNNKYLRKDRNDSNGAFKLSIGHLVADTATIERLNLPSLATSTATEYLVVGANGLVGKRTIDQMQFGIANNTGTNQFLVNNGGQIRFAGTGDTQVSFNAANNTITINSVPGQGGGGVVTSVFGRQGGVVAELGDYSTDLVTEGSNKYFTEPRVLSTVLTGLTPSAIPVNSTDNIIQAFGKLQGQINATAKSNVNLLVSGTTGRTIVSGGSQNLTEDREWIVDLSNSGVTAGTYTKLTVDAYGRATSGGSLVASDIPSLSASKITSGVFDLSRLGSGTPGSGTYIDGGTGAWTALPSVDLAGYYTKTETNTLLGDKANNTITITGAGGLTGGGDLTANRTISMANVPTNTIKGRVAAGTGPPTDLTVAQVRTMLSINNVDNTSDLNKPISTATGTALGLKANTADISAVGFSGSYNDLLNKPAIPLGTVTSVGMTVPTGLSVSGSPITSSGVLAIGLQTGYSIPTTAKQNSWDAKFDYPTGTTSQYIRGDGSLATLPAQAVTNLAVGTRTATAIPVTNSNGTGFTIPEATTTLAGLLTSADKTKLNGLSNYVLPVATSSVLGGVKQGANITIAADGTISSSYVNTTYTAGTGISLVGTTFGQTITTSGTGTFVTGVTQTTNGFQVNLGTPAIVQTNLALGTRTSTTVPVTNSNGTGFTIPVSTPSLAGVMSAEDKTKLDGLGAGKASNFTTTSDVTINWQSDFAYDEAGNPTSETWAQRYGNSVFILRLRQDGAIWRDESDQVAFTMSGSNIQTVNFHTVFSNTRISITGKGGGAAVGLFTNKGDWVSGTYKRGDYVTSTSTGGSGKSIFFLIGEADYTSSIAPASDLVHWSEVPTAAGPKGDKGDTGDTGATGATGPGVATGGTAGQVLAKIDGTNFNTQWITPATGLTLGETSTTAYRGDRGKEAYDLRHSHANKAVLDGISGTDITNWNNAIQSSQKGAVNGVASLGADGKIPNGQIPAIALTETFVVNSQSAMLALSAEMGDVAVRTDISKSFILVNNVPTVLGNWQELLSPSIVNSDQVPEGSTNLYYTQARARGAISASGTGISYNNTTGVITANIFGTSGTTVRNNTQLDARYLQNNRYSAIINVTANRTIALSDENAYWIVTGNRTITVPTNATVAFPIGARIDVAIRDSGSAIINGASGVTLNHAGGTGNVTKTGVLWITLLKTGTNGWDIIGGN